MNALLKRTLKRTFVTKLCQVERAVDDGWFWIAHDPGTILGEGLSPKSHSPGQIDDGRVSGAASPRKLPVEISL
jgi:hypothetical protein